VYCRAHFQPESRAEYRGVRLITLPTIRSKYFDTIVHASVSTLHAVTQRYDAALYFIAGNSPVAWIPRLAGQRVALNVDGLDWRRAKWPGPAKSYLKAAERLSRFTANKVVTDSRVVVDFYRDHYGFSPRYIPYGSDVSPRPPGEILRRYALEPRRYVLFVGRLVPENCVHHLIEAFVGLKTDMKCVIVGDAPYAEAYKARLRRTDDPRVVFTGYLFGDGYAELSSSCYAFIETSEVGGTHPALLEAMGFGSAVVANGTAENRETIADAGLAYDTWRGSEALRSALGQLLDNPELRDEMAERASRRARDVYSWDRVTDQYEEMFYEMLDSDH
jgi:glycosyltransferase involved in cell wall biosynthesis